MSTVAIRADRLTKRYRSAARRLRRAARLDRARRQGADSRGTAAGGRTLGRPPRRKWIWALDDVSFEVADGEIVGIVGRNGSGKSTLLKILSRITEPTSGQAVVRGRVGSLLEVGTGFHPS